MNDLGKCSCGANLIKVTKYDSPKGMTVYSYCAKCRKKDILVSDPEYSGPIQGLFGGVM